jgi:hypothetical protein
MPTTNGLTLTLTTVDSTVTVRVTYNAVFSQFERKLAALGLEFREEILTIGMDPPGSLTGTIVGAFSTQAFPVTDGIGPQTIARDRSKSFPRAALQEDAATGDNDEIRCRIKIKAEGFPPEVTPDAWTPEKTLLG